MRATRDVGIYYYLLPTFAQGRKVIWEGMDNTGRRFLDYVPRSLLDGKPKEDDMQLKIKTRREGKKATSILQIVGSDNYDHLMGTNPRGIVLSEYALQNPSAWDFFRPMLRANQGWAIFVYTPRGKNHGYDLFEIAKKQIEQHKSPHWHVQRLTIDDTFDRIENGIPIPIISKEDVEQERREGMPEELIKQEYYCSFEAGNIGSFYSNAFEQIDMEGRIRSFEYEPKNPVDTFWDVGISDDTAIWFIQKVAGEIRVIDCYSGFGKSIGQHIKAIHEKPYTYGQHIGPHDLEQSQLGTGQSIKEVAQGLGIRFQIAPRLPVMDGIDSGRRMVIQCYFKKDTTEDGIKALRHYHRKWDAKLKRFTSRPHHDWSSHYSDAWRMFATTYDGISRLTRPKITIVNDFSVYG